MIGILMIWLIAGILLIVFSSLMYYNETFGFLGFTVILLLGIVIFLVSTSNIISLQKKQKVSGKPNAEALKNTFIVLIVVSVLVFGLGFIGYLLGALGIYEFDPRMTNTLFGFMTVGSLSAIGGIFSWIYAERSVPASISSEISKQQRIIDTMKRESDEVGMSITSMKKEISELTETAAKIRERDREGIQKG